MSMPQNLEQARFNMIEQQIRPWDVHAPEILELLNTLHREDFVPESQRAIAFVDMEVPLPGGQVMLAPKYEARVMQELKVQKNEKVLEIGAATGHLAALLGRQAQRVIALEADAGLATQAAANLRRAGVLNVTVHNQDGAGGLPAEEPFDVILLSGSEEHFATQARRRVLARMRAQRSLLARTETVFSKSAK